MKKKFIKILCFALIAIMRLGAVACSKDNEPQDSDSAQTETESSTPPADDNGDNQEEEKKPTVGNMTEKKLYASRKGIKLIGERARVSDSCIFLDYIGQGFELAVNLKADVMNLVVTGNSKFRIWIDGEAFKNSDGGYDFSIVDSELVKLTGLPLGEHTIRVLKSDNNSARASVTSAVFDGRFLDSVPTQNKEHLIEFFGDNSLMNAELCEAFPFLTAQTVNADFMINAWNGATLATAGDDYINIAPFDSTSKQSYGFERKANAVVVSIGKNDTMEASAFESAYMALIKNIILNNGEGTKVYCVYDDSHSYKNAIESACEELGGNVAGVFAVKLTGADEASKATQLSALIADTIDDETVPLGKSGVGTIVSWTDGEETTES